LNFLPQREPKTIECLRELPLQIRKNKITKNQERITIFCDDKGEPFFPYFSKNKIELDYQTTKNALITLLSQLHSFSEKLDNLAAEFKVDNIADILIWGQNEKEQSLEET